MIKKITLLLLLVIAFSWQGNAQSTINITTSGGSYGTEKWVNITTEVDGAGTQVWGQGDGSYGNSSGLINVDIDIAPGTYYVNCYDKFDDGWDGTLISVTAYGSVLNDNGGVSPSDGDNSDSTSSFDTPAEELEASLMIVVPTAPSCAPPTGTALTSMTEPDSASFSWNAPTGASGYNYEIQPQGTAQGTAGALTSGSTTSTSFSTTGLVSGTDYTLYIQTDCGGGDSSAYTSLDFNFNPPPANDNLAGATPITPSAEGTGCDSFNFQAWTANSGVTDSGMDGTCGTTYTGLDVFYTWTADVPYLVWNDGDGSPGIVIRDTSGTEITCKGTYAPNDYVLSGWSVGDNLIIQIYDFSSDDVDVSFCLEKKSLIDPTFTLSANGDCPNSQFTVDVDITDLGGSSAVTITDDQASASQNATAIGIKTFGPYPSGTTVEFTVTSDDDTTSTSTDSLAFYCPPPNNDLANAIPITPSPEGTGCSSYTFQGWAGGSGATDSGLDGSCSNTSTGLDVFYTWTADVPYLVWNDGDGYPGIVIRDTSGTEITCRTTYAPNDYVLSGWNVGDDLIIQIYDYGTSDVDVSFCLEKRSIIDPTFTLTTTTDCANSQFTVDVDITDLGSSSAVTITDNQASASQNATAIGIKTFGPYSSGTIVVFTVESDDDATYKSTDSISGDCPPTNNTLADAIPITPSEEGTGCSSYTFVAWTGGTGASDSGMDGTCSTTNTGLDVFYSWTADVPYLVWNDGDGNPGIVIRDTSGTEITCRTTYAPDDYILSGWNVGDDLIIQIYDYGTADVDVTFCLEKKAAINPTATYTTTDDCANNQFSIDVEVTDMGGGTALTITDDQNSTSQAATALGIFTFGPYAVGTPVVITIANDANPAAYFTTSSTLTDSCPVIPDYSNDFATFPGDNWSLSEGAFGAPDLADTTSNWQQDDYLNDTTHANGKAARINIYGTSTDEYLISLPINLSGGTYYLNYEIGLTDFIGTGSDTMGSDDYLSLLVSEDEGATWSELKRWTAADNLPNTGMNAPEIVLSGYGASTLFAFYAFSDTINTDYNVYIDNFSVTSSTLGVVNTSISGFAYYPNPVNDQLSLRANNNIDNVILRNILGQTVLAVEPSATSIAIDMSQLKQGTYFVSVQVGDAIQTVKVMKN